VRIIAAFESGKMFPIGTSMTTGLTDTLHSSQEREEGRAGGARMAGCGVLSECE